MARVYSIENIKNIFTKVSLTNQYKLDIKVNPKIRNFINNNYSDDLPGIVKTGPNDIYSRGDSSGLGGLDEKVSVLCKATQIPGLGFEFETLNGARQGISEIFPTYRRYTAFDCTFIVDKDHDVLRFFNRWMNMISPLQQSTGFVSPQSGLIRSDVPSEVSGVARGSGVADRSNFYKMKYKDSYVCDITLTKFEKDSFGPDLNDRWLPKKSKGFYDVTNGLTYTFYRAFPVEITPSPVSYDTTDVFQINVTFEYERYSVS